MRDVQLLRQAGRDVRIVGDDLHAEGQSAARDFDADAAESDDAERLAAKLGALQRLLLPLAGLHGGVSAHQDERASRQHESEGVLGDGNSIAAGRIHHHDAALGGGVEIDVVDAHAGAPDDAQLGSLVHHGRVDEGRRANHDGIGIGQFAGERLFVGRNHGPIAVFAENLAARKERFCQR